MCMASKLHHWFTKLSRSKSLLILSVGRMNHCFGGLVNENGPHGLIGHSIIRRYSLVGVAVAFLEDVT